MPDATPSNLFTSESVTEGHPDKLCDAIADALLDDVLTHDTDARCAIEVATTTGLVLVLGELSTRHWVDVQDVVRGTVREIGYIDARIGFEPVHRCSQAAAQCGRIGGSRVPQAGHQCDEGKRLGA